jgi:hypothetical protein
MQFNVQNKNQDNAYSEVNYFKTTANSYEDSSLILDEFSKFR